MLERQLERRRAATAGGEKDRTYVAVDLKSFYASVECRDRGLDPLTTHLVVADPSRTEKTICLAVSPALKAQGIPGRPRLFEVQQQVARVNAARRAALSHLQKAKRAPVPDGVSAGELTGSAKDAAALSDPFNALDFIIAPPRMARYMEYSTQIYQIYLRFVAHEDIHAYSVDEVFMDVTDYLHLYDGDPHRMTLEILRSVLDETGMTATAGIGTNLYLAKIAMDIVAKHLPADEEGARIAELDELTYRQLLWSHSPLTDFWRLGPGYARKLHAHGLFTMGDIARCGLEDPDLLYRLFGVNAELLIDHSFGWEPARIADIHAYVPESRSLSTGQVLSRPYAHEEGALIVREMADSLSLMLTEKALLTDQLVLDVGYDIENLSGASVYQGEVKTDRYGRKVPRAAHGSAHLEGFTDSSSAIADCAVSLYRRICNPALSIRRLVVVAAHVKKKADVKAEPVYEQMSLFSLEGFGTTDGSQDGGQAKKGSRQASLINARTPEGDRAASSGKTSGSPLSEEAGSSKALARLRGGGRDPERESRLQEAALAIRKKYGKNAVLKGMNLEEGGTMRERNAQIGGHKA